MEYLNLHSSTLDSERVLEASADQVGVWVFLLRFCVGQENEGRIVGVALWADAKVRRLLRCTRRALRQVSSLWRWEADDLVVEFYPAKQEKSLKAIRRVRAKAGRASGAARRGEMELPLPGREAPSLEEALAYGQQVVAGVGTMNGLPVIDPDWIRDWHRWRSNMARSWESVRSWKDLMTADWRKQWKGWEARKRKASGAAGGIATSFPGETPKPNQKVNVL